MAGRQDLKRGRERQDEGKDRQNGIREKRETCK